MEEINIYLNDLNEKLKAPLNLSEIINSYSHVFKNNPCLFFFTALQLSYIKERRFKDCLDDINCFKMFSCQFDQKKKFNSLYFNIFQNYIINISGLINENFLFDNSLGDELTIFVLSLPEFFREKPKDQFYEECLNEIKDFVRKLQFVQKFLEPNCYKTVEDFLEKAIQKIEQNSKDNNSIEIKNQNNKNFQKVIINEEDKINLMPKEQKNSFLNNIVQENINSLHLNKNVFQLNNSISKNHSLFSSISMDKNSFESNNSIKVFNSLLNISKNKNKSIDNKMVSNEKIKTMLDHVSFEFYLKYSTIKFNIKSYKDEKYHLKLIGSYSLSTIKSKDSYIDYVFMPNSNDKTFLEKEEIIQWILQFNKNDFCLLKDEDPTSNKEERVLDFNYFNFESKESVDKSLPVNIFLYRNKYIKCNEMFEKIFKEEKHIIILHSFFYHILISSGLENGSEVCFLITAFLDLKYNIFDLNTKKIGKAFVYKEKKKTISESEYYYYPLIEEKISQVENIKTSILIKQFNHFIISLIEKNIDLPNRLLEGKYLFNIKFFNKQEFEKNLYEKLDEEIDKGKMTNYKDILNNIGLNINF